eukprot:16437003-Heterocapsa_arctica.AAC.1
MPLSQRTPMMSPLDDVEQMIGERASGQGLRDVELRLSELEDDAWPAHEGVRVDAGRVLGFPRPVHRCCRGPVWSTSPRPPGPRRRCQRSYLRRWSQACYLRALDMAERHPDQL